jgi:hypothetical protein
MSDPSARDQRASIWAKAWITAIPLVSAVCAVGFGASLACSQEDTESLETPLLMSVARQLYRSPWELYGPFGGENPWVLIHAPLYYRVAALAAWPLARAGIDPVLAALVAGRSLSLVGLVVTLAAAYRLARLDGAPPIAGWWTVFLIVSAPLLNSQPYSVRPDMMGIALQTTGLLLVLTVLRSKRRRGVMLVAAFAAFALAACVKQHFVVVSAISTVWLLAAWRRDRYASRLITRGLLMALTIVLLVYGAEELASAGRMSRAIFRAAANVGQVHPSDWMRVLIVFFAITGRCAGICLLLTGAGLSLIQDRPGFVPAAIAAVGTCCVGLFVVLQAYLVLAPSDLGQALLVAALIATIILLIPLCARFERRAIVGGQLDAALWLYMTAELVLVVVLCRASTGAWVNYAIQAVIFGSILASRAVARAFASAASTRALLPIALAALNLLPGPLHFVYPAVSHRDVEHFAKEMIFDRMKRPRHEFFFVDRPGDNRLHGRFDLVYDDWLYPVFESIDLAEPRSGWLLHRLTGGSVRCIVNTSSDPHIPGISETLPKLGFASRIQVGPFFVWERDLVATARRRLKYTP